MRVIDSSEKRESLPTLSYKNKGSQLRKALYTKIKQKNNVIITYKCGA